MGLGKDDNNSSNIIKADKLKATTLFWSPFNFHAKIIQLNHR